MTEDDSEHMSGLSWLLDGLLDTIASWRIVVPCCPKRRITNEKKDSCHLKWEIDYDYHIGMMPRSYTYEDLDAVVVGEEKGTQCVP